MQELTRDVFVELWKLTKAGRRADDDGLARMQKYMEMHDDMHAHFDRIAEDPEAPVEVEGEHLPLHVAMDAATEAALEADEPAGVRDLMQSMLDARMDPGVAFHVISQAMMHEFITAAGEGHDMEAEAFLARAAQYAVQARQQG